MYVVQTDLSQRRLKVTCFKFATLSNKGNKISHDLRNKVTVFTVKPRSVLSMR